MRIQVYVCPTDGCGNYYGTSGMPDLSKQYTGPKTEDRFQVPLEQSRVGVAGKRHSRAECPDCRQNGIYVDRELRMIVIPPRRDLLVKRPEDAQAEREALESLHP